MKFSINQASQKLSFSDIYRELIALEEQTTEKILKIKIHQYKKDT